MDNINPLKIKIKNPTTGLEEEIEIKPDGLGLQVSGKVDWEWWLLHPWVKWGWPWKALGIPGKALERFSYFMGGGWRNK